MWMIYSKEGVGVDGGSVRFQERKLTVWQARENSVKK